MCTLARSTYQKLGEVLVRDVGELLAVVLGDDQLRTNKCVSK